MESSFHSHLDFNTVITTNFCTWHDRCAVVACAKICCALMASKGITTRRNFHRNWIAGKKSLAKRPPPPPAVHSLQSPTLLCIWFCYLFLLTYSLRYYIIIDIHAILIMNVGGTTSIISFVFVHTVCLNRFTRLYMYEIRKLTENTWGWFNIKMQSYHCKNSHHIDKTVSRTSHFCNRAPWNSKTASLFWIGSM